jgi:pimeloyl-ACP methyl ester carboxylesterase
MPGWTLDQDVETSVGRVASGLVGRGDDLVLAHGWPWSSYSWHRIIPKLAERYRVHWYDMPGFGQSQICADQRTSLDVQSEIFCEMLDHWKLKTPSVIAHDFGDAITLRAHLLNGRDYQRYVLMNVVAMRPWGSDFFDHVGRHVKAFQGLPAHIHQAIVKAYIRGALAHDIDPSDFTKLVEPWLGVEGSGSFYCQFAQADECYTAEIEPMFGKLRCPVKILWGEDDPWIPIDRGRALHKLVGQGEFQTLAQVGHLPQLEAPERVLAALENFL